MMMKSSGPWIGVLALMLTCWAGGCADKARPGGGEGEGEKGDCPLDVCEVFITELLINPRGDDAQNEYVELFNPGNAALDLRGCTLQLKAGTGKAKTHIIGSVDPVAVPAKGFLLLGPENALNVGYRWSKLGELPNSSSSGPVTFSLRAGSTVVTSVTYLSPEAANLGSPRDGASFQLNAAEGSFTCQAAGNDASWCPGEQPSGDNRGTPGEPNQECPVPHECTLTECDVFFTEVLANPRGADSASEYVELFNPTSQALDLRGCILELAAEQGEPKQHVISAVNAVEVPAQGFLLIGPEQALGVSYHWSQLGDLPNSSSKGAYALTLKSGGTVISSFRYLIPDSNRLGAPNEGESFQLSSEPDKLTCAGSTEEANWCSSSQLAGDNKGTPGTLNEACPPPPEPCQLAPCSLFFTEFMVNPKGTDEEKEYVELYNPGEEDLNLNGCSLELQAGTGNPKNHLIIEQVVVPAGGFVTLGPPESENAQVHWGSLGGLPNSSSTGPVAVRLLTNASGDWVEVDSFTYLNPGGEGLGAPIEGQSYQLGRDIIDGIDYFTCASNDDAAHWCLSVRPLGDDKGTPGRINDFCQMVMCVPQNEAGGELPEHEAVPPAPGEIIISEIYPNPPCTPEPRDHEWFEVLNTSARDIDLVNTGLYTRSTDLAPRFTFADADMHCFTVPAGARMVLAANANPEQNGGIAASYSYLGKVALPNSNGYLELRLADRATVVDAVSWQRSTEGRSLELNPDAACESAAGNDLSDCWHVSPKPQSTVCAVPTYHTAGEDNETAGACYCTDPDGGAWQRLDSTFAVGEIELTELLADVPGAEAANAGMEWVEVEAKAPGYLNCGALGISGNPRDFPWTECWPLQAGDRVVLAANADPVFNGGLPQQNLGQLGTLALRDHGGDLSLLFQGVEVDTVLDYGDTAEGHALQKDREGAWCEASQPYGDLVDGNGNPLLFGTPGAVNPDCPFVPPPVPEGSCLPAAGGEPRPVLSPPADAVIFSEFFANPAGVESTREWIELYVAQGGPYDLNGLKLKLQDNAPSTLQADACVRVEQGDWVLLARSNDPEANDNLPPAEMLFSGALVNSNITLQLLSADEATVIDAVSYAPASPEGKSIQLDLGKLDAAQNDLVESWCVAAEAGSPGAANVACAP